MEAVSIIVTIVVLALAVAAIAGLWMVFEKAGESGWKAIIPIYNYYILLRISGHSGWWLLIFLLPALPSLLSAFTGIASAQQTTPGLEEALAGSQASPTLGILAMVIFVTVFMLINIVIIVQGIILYDVARSFGKGLGFTIGLGVLPFIFWPILGFGKSEYRGPVAHPKMVAAGSGAHVPPPTPEADEDDADDADDSDKKNSDQEAKQTDSQQNDEPTDESPEDEKDEDNSTNKEG